MRDLFLLDPSVIFLNHGSFGACPRPVFERYQAWQRELENQPVEFLGRRYNDLMYHAISALANFVGANPENLLYVTNATFGLATVGRSLRLTPDDEILTTDHEYGALNLMWRYLSRETGCKIVVRELPRYIDDRQALVEHIWGGVTDKTKLIFMSHITSPTALILPVEEICQRARQAGILSMIDGAHVPGHLPLNLEALGADFYSGNNHKWLCAPKGSALLYVRPEHHSMIDPLVISWGWDKETLFERTVWQGTQDIASYLATEDAILFRQQYDWEQIYQQSHHLATEAMQMVAERFRTRLLATAEFFGQMALLPLPPCDVVTIKKRLYDEYRIEVPLTEHGGRQFARISMQAYNTREDAMALVNALGELL